MARIDNLSNFLSDVADAIRTKKGTAGTIPANTFDTEIASIQGGSSKYAPRFIRFYNYKGTELNEEIANLDTSNITDMSYMFYTNNMLQSLDLSNFDVSNVTNMGGMFQNCYKLSNLYLGTFDTSKVTSMNRMFEGCKLLVTIKKLDAIKSVGVNSIFKDCLSLNDFGGLENLGQAYDTSKSANYSNYKLDLSTCTALTEQSLINVLTNLYDIATNGCNTQQVVLGSTNLEKLTSEEGQSALASATEKGWSIS